jgi:hypothetical protein
MHSSQSLRFVDMHVHFTYWIAILQHILQSFHLTPLNSPSIGRLGLRLGGITLVGRAPNLQCLRSSKIPGYRYEREEPLQWTYTITRMERFPCACP